MTAILGYGPFLRVLLLAAAGYMVFVLAVSQPRPERRSEAYGGNVQEVAGVVDEPGGDVALKGASAGAIASSEYPESPPVVLPAGPRTVAATDVRIGPGERFAVVGLIPRDARLDVTGRDASGEWLSIVFRPGSEFRGWVRRTSVIGVDVTLLEVVPTTPAPRG